MPDSLAVQCRRQFCQRCGQSMFEYYCSADGHFGLVDDLSRDEAARPHEVRCPTCSARYRLLDRLNALGQPVERLKAER